MPIDPADQRRKLPHGQHVWVRDGVTEQPGLLLWWEKRGTAWWGRVAMVDPGGDPALVDVMASLLRPAVEPVGETPPNAAGSGPQ